MSERVVIVGGTAGIGLSAAALLARTGRDVVIAGRAEDRLEQALKEIGEGATGAVVDARDPEATRAFLAGVAPVDHVVITVTGRGQAAGPLASLTAGALRGAVEDKLIAHLMTAQAAAGVMRPGGSLTFVTAASAGAAFPGVSGLAAVNGAIEATVPGLAVELAPIRVNAVSPGVVDTGWWEWLGEERRAALDGFAAGTAVGRVGTPDDVAEAVAYLVGASYTTGTILRVDGGGFLKP
ncbi:SDR family oxidoreductase [Microbispora corallina]|uniref:Short-chain dehydrogenase n=1 Tax=Microbispora corallina TaxID=83302 RepID=A0ABQ4FT05_9ACTN|nr:SDR family oxidoreductase [Microbispora corallina]GIH37965.1 short-chain dehydrogenase [Microbispora corallina]